MTVAFHPHDIFYCSSKSNSLKIHLIFVFSSCVVLYYTVGIQSNVIYFPCSLNDCDLTDRSCSALATVLGSDTNLKELNLNNNNLQDSGVKLLCTGLENIKCELEILRLSDCSINEEGYKALASVLRSNPSHLIELDLTGNDPGQSGVKELSDSLKDPNCKLKTLRWDVMKQYKMNDMQFNY
uniref:Uncharacterized protein n=1 Tax=Cyprinus carpio TaxID=7962 RepID=A0A8C1UK74_CYPCA